MFTVLDAARGAAKRLKAATDGRERPQKLTHCQAVVATACGFNGRQHLAKTLGTPHEPGDARDKDVALRRFSETVRSLLPATYLGSAAVLPQSHLANYLRRGGLLARRVRDLWLGLTLLTRRDARNAWWVPAPLPFEGPNRPLSVALLRRQAGVVADPSVLQAPDRRQAPSKAPLVDVSTSAWMA